MKLFSLSLKNIFVNWWRSLTLGSFIFLASFLLFVFNSFAGTIKVNIQNALINSLTGHIQIRAGYTTEEDMFSMKGNWGEISYLEAEQISQVEKVLGQQVKPVEYTKRVRHNGLFVSDADKVGSMFIGLDPQVTEYQSSLKLLQGQYLSSNGSHEVILSDTQADKLKVKIGDTIGVMAQSKDGYTIDGALKVVGIGKLNMLSMFSLSVAYMDLKSAQELIGFENNEVTDIILYTPSANNLQPMVKNLSQQLNPGGKANYKITTWEKMGGFVMGIIGLTVAMLYGFIFILFIIISVLIINLIFMMGLERRQEIGTLRAIGFSQFKIIQIFIAEIMLIAASFCVIGIGAGILLVFFLSKITIAAGPPLDYVMGDQFKMMFNIGLVVPVFCIVSIFTFFASFFPSYSATSVKPVETLKEI
jgi:putative ABC transport system permease protein